MRRAGVHHRRRRALRRRDTRRVRRRARWGWRGAHRSRRMWRGARAARLLRARLPALRAARGADRLARRARRDLPRRARALPTQRDAACVAPTRTLRSRHMHMHMLCPLAPCALSRRGARLTLWTRGRLLRPRVETLFEPFFCLVPRPCWTTPAHAAALDPVCPARPPDPHRLSLLFASSAVEARPCGHHHLGAHRPAQGPHRRRHRRAVRARRGLGAGAAVGARRCRREPQPRRHLGGERRGRRGAASAVGRRAARGGVQRRGALSHAPQQQPRHARDEAAASAAAAAAAIDGAAEARAHMIMSCEART
mmetsp:Transcript_65748/g.196467  ORF Transcript_65748/g.196467 Transcript_65748/m.196467 type:complete len:310 (+) Transcript_65748:434-1363(+)